MGHFRVRLCWIAFLTLVMGNSGASINEESYRTVVMIAGRDQEGPAGKAARAIRSQLLDLNVRFNVHWVPGLELALPDQTLVAAKVARTERALMVLMV